MSLFQFLKSKTFLKHLGLAFLALLVLVILILQWLKASTNHGEYIEVPDLARKPVFEVRELLDDVDLRFEVLDSAEYNPDFPRFSVIEQNPPAGDHVKENRKIYLTINPAGYKDVTIPNIIQVTRRNAESMLRAVGLDIQRVTYIDQLGKDMVYYIKHKGADVSPGDKLPKTSKIELICGNGNVTERALIQANSETESNGGD